MAETLLSLENPYLTISVYNTKGHLVAAEQEVPYPLYARSHSIWWGHVYYFRVPLEQVDNDMWVFKIKLQEMPANTYKETRSNTGQFRMDKETVVNSGFLCLDLKDDEGDTQRDMKLELTLEVSCWCQNYTIS